jgi:signal transduction histidine kinase
VTTNLLFLAASVPAGIAGVFAAALGVRSRRAKRGAGNRRDSGLALDHERIRIARDLHDGLGADLTRIGLMAERLARRAIDADVRTGLVRIAADTRRAAGELETIIWSVGPGNNTLDRLAAYVGRHAQRFFQGTGIDCAVDASGPIPDLTLDAHSQHNLLSVTKEALNNVLKHAGAASVRVSTGFQGGVFSLAFRDDGVGFVTDAPRDDDANGLANMRRRMEEAGGRLEVDSAPGRGTTISLRLSFSGALREPRPVPSAVR